MATTRTPVRFADPPVQPPSSSSARGSESLRQYGSVGEDEHGRPSSGASVYYSPSSTPAPATPRPLQSTPRAAITPRIDSSSSQQQQQQQQRSQQHQHALRPIRVGGTTQPSQSILSQRLVANTAVLLLLFAYHDDIKFILLIALKPLVRMFSLPMSVERYLETIMSGCMFILAYNAILAAYALITYSPTPIRLEKLQSSITHPENNAFPQKEFKLSPQKLSSATASIVSTPSIRRQSFFQKTPASTGSLFTRSPSIAATSPWATPTPRESFPPSVSNTPTPYGDKGSESASNSVKKLRELMIDKENAERVQKSGGSIHQERRGWQFAPQNESLKPFQPASRSPVVTDAKKERKDLSSHAVIVPFDEVIQQLDIRDALLRSGKALRSWIRNHVIQPLLTTIQEIDNHLTSQNLRHLTISFNQNDTTFVMPMNVPRSWSEYVAQVGMNPIVLARGSVEDYLNVGFDGKIDENSRSYVYERLKTMAADVELGSYTWDGGMPWRGKPWSTNLPTDAEIIFRVFCTFMNQRMRDLGIYTSPTPFTSQFILSPNAPISFDDTIRIRIFRFKPTLKLGIVTGSKSWEVLQGRKNVFYCILIFLQYFKANAAGYLDSLYLGLPLGLLDVLEE